MMGYEGRYIKVFRSNESIYSCLKTKSYDLYDGDADDVHIQDANKARYNILDNLYIGDPHTFHGHSMDDDIVDHRFLHLDEMETL